MGLSIQKHTKKIFIGGAVVLGLCLTLISVAPFAVHAQPATTPGTQTAPGGQTQQQQGNATQTCAIEKIGWILCPILEKTAEISDSAFEILANNFLNIDASLLTDKPLANGSQSGTILAWGIARNIANIAFIIAFLAIVISQVTGMGISNYGLKKMTPRLIVAAIAVNVSYYICQAAVDLSNIFGYEIQNALASIANQIGPSVFGNIQNAALAGSGNVANSFSQNLQNPGILLTIAAGALAGGAVVWLMLPTLASLVPLILITVLTIIIVLLLRKAIVVLLVVISPLAFVAYLLPNTERYFQKWMSMFGQLLMVFPVVGLLFGAGQLASTIILAAGANNNAALASQTCNPQNKQQRQQFEALQQGTGAGAIGALGNNANNGASYATCGGGMIQIQGPDYDAGNNTPGSMPGKTGTPVIASWQLGLVATGIAVAPLLAVWSVLKGALSAAGAIGGKISGAVEKGVSKSVNGGVNAGKKGWEKSAFGRGQAYRKQIKQNYKNDQFAKRMSGGRRNPRSLYTQLAARGISGNIGTMLNKGNINAPGVGAMKAQDARLESMFRGEAEKIQSQEMQEAGLKTRDLDNAQLNAVVEKGTVDDPEVAAAVKELIKRQDFEGIERALNKFGNAQGLTSRVMGAELGSTGLFTGGQLGNIERGALRDSGTSYSSIIGKNIEDGLMSPEKMASAGKSVLEEASRQATSQKARDALTSSAVAASTDEILKQKISRNKDAIAAFAQGKGAHSGGW